MPPALRLRTLMISLAWISLFQVQRRALRLDQVDQEEGDQNPCVLSHFHASTATEFDVCQIPGKLAFMALDVTEIVTVLEVKFKERLSQLAVVTHSQINDPIVDVFAEGGAKHSERFEQSHSHWAWDVTCKHLHVNLYQALFQRCGL